LTTESGNRLGRAFVIKLTYGKEQLCSP